MLAVTLVQLVIGIAFGLLSLASQAASTEDVALRTFKDMALDPHGFVHVAEDGIARSYAANGTVIDYTPLSNSQLINMVNDLLVTTKTDKKHLAEVFAVVNGFSVKDEHQIFHPSTQLRPAVDPAQTHWHEDTSTDHLSQADDFPEKRSDVPECIPLLCQGEYFLSKEGCTKFGCPCKSCLYAFLEACYGLIWPVVLAGWTLATWLWTGMKEIFLILWMLALLGMATKAVWDSLSRLLDGVESPGPAPLVLVLGFFMVLASWTAMTYLWAGVFEINLIVWGLHLLHFGIEGFRAHHR